MSYKNEMDKKITKDIETQLKLNIFNEYCYDKENLKFLNDLLLELGDQVGFNSRQNLLMLNKNIQNSSYAQDPQIYLDQYCVKEQLDIYLNQYFTLQLIVKNIQDKSLDIENSIRNIKGKIKNALNSKNKSSGGTSSLLYKLTQIKIGLESNEVNIKKELNLIPSLNKKIKSIKRFISLNYLINLDDLKSETLFSLNSLIKNGLYKAKTLKFELNLEHNLIQQSEEFLIFYVNDKLLSLTQLLKLMETKQLYLQPEYLNSKTLAAYFVLFNEFKKDENEDFSNNYNVFKGLFKEQVNKNKDTINHFPLFEKIQGRLKDGWDYLISQHNDFANDLISTCMMVFLLKEFIFDINKVSSICSSFK